MTDVEMRDANDDSLQPVRILIDELKSDDVQVRLTSIRGLTTIATALGPERTRNELLPFLKDSTDDEDDVLTAMAKVLGEFCPLVGGPDHAHHVLSVLEVLCAAEETKAREHAVQSIVNIFNQMSKEQVAMHAYPLVKRLAEGDWFTMYTAACGLIPALYPQLTNDQRAEFRAHYAKFVNNSAPIVRRAASANLGKLVRELEPEVITNEILPLFATTAADEQDSVRFLSVETCVALASKLSSEEAEKLVLPTIKSLITDSSWRVRYMAADKFTGLSAIGDDSVKVEMVAQFIALLRDAEPEVRTAAASKISEYCSMVPEATIVDQILPVARELVNDPSEHVRASLASNVMGLAPLLGKEKTLQHLQDIFLKLLKDEVPEVRLNVISKLDAINKVIGVDLLSQSLLPAIMELAEDRQWRVRLAIINYIPLLANQLGVEFFDEKLAELCLSWLGDKVYSIREAATVNLQKLIEVFGVEWAQSNIIPKVLNLNSHQNYLYRMTTLVSICSLAKVMGPDAIDSTLLPLVLGMATDRVPNIRFNACKALEASIPHVTEACRETRIKPVLTKLYNEDSDSDVKFFANKALQVLNSCSA